jgi:HD-GYP domain-containing protein (c-di-GMP phosphodiesterase class II)
MNPMTPESDGAPAPAGAVSDIVLASALSSVPFAVLVIRGHAVLAANPVALSQLNALDIDDAFDSLRAKIHPEDHNAFFVSLSHAETHHVGFKQHVRIRDRESDFRRFEFQAYPHWDADGNFQSVVLHAVQIDSEGNSLTRAREAAEAMSRAFAALSQNFEATIRALVKTIEAKDPYVAGHSERVMRYSTIIGYEMGLTHTELDTLEIGALIHDVGKIGIPDEILTKPSRLTEQEFDVVKQHPSVGYHLISEIPMFAACADIVRDHHERLDGTGYPRGLKGDQIGKLVRIVATADIFDALTSSRSYRHATGIEFAVGVLKDEANRGRLDPEVVRVFTDTIDEESLLVAPEAVREAA